jgi:hypothetical protein
MTASNKHHPVQALPYREDNRGLEQRYPPASFCWLELCWS